MNINLTHLREWANEFIDIPPGIIDHDQTMARGVLALIEAVEAAHENIPHAIRHPSSGADGLRSRARLQTALARFDFRPPA